MGSRDFGTGMKLEQRKLLTNYINFFHAITLTWVWLLYYQRYTVITKQIFHQRFVNKILKIICSGLYLKTAQEKPDLFRQNTRLWNRACKKGNLNLINNK